MLPIPRRHAMVNLWLEGNSGKAVLFFYCVGCGDWTQALEIESHAPLPDKSSPESHILGPGALANVTLGKTNYSADLIPHSSIQND